MTVDNKKMILIIEDEDIIRGIIKSSLEAKGYKVLQAEHMEEAYETLLGNRWNEIDLIIVDIMLPKDSEDAKTIKNWIVQRDEAYDDWMELENKGMDHGDIEWLKTRFKVDSLDRKIFDTLNVNGGIELMKSCVSEYGKDNKLYKPVIYFTSRENEAIRQEGISLVANGLCKWLVKPVKQEQLEITVIELLEKS